MQAGEIRNGNTFELEGQVFQVIEFQHVKPGKGAAFVRTKLRNVINGGVVEKTFRPTEKLEDAFVERVDMAYSFDDGLFYNYMDSETFEMVQVPHELAEDAMKFVKENEICKIMSYKGNVFAVEAPNFVELTVTETEPGLKGDTQTNVMKPAIVETGASIKIPLFINEGEVIRIDTRTEEYLGRA